jgi:hypothetical protein
LFPSVNIRDSPTSITFALKDVVEPGAVVVVIVEELSVERYGTSIGACVNELELAGGDAT